MNTPATRNERSRPERRQAVAERIAVSSNFQARSALPTDRTAASTDRGRLHDMRRHDERLRAVCLDNATTRMNWRSVRFTLTDRPTVLQTGQRGFGMMGDVSFAPFVTNRESSGAPGTLPALRSLYQYRWCSFAHVSST